MSVLGCTRFMNNIEYTFERNEPLDGIFGDCVWTTDVYDISDSPPEFFIYDMGVYPCTPTPTPNCPQEQYLISGPLCRMQVYAIMLDVLGVNYLYVNFHFLTGKLCKGCGQVDGDEIYLRLVSEQRATIQGGTCLCPDEYSGFGPQTGWSFVASIIDEFAQTCVVMPNEFLYPFNTTNATYTLKDSLDVC
jgi:hypothetical protein